MKNNFFKMACVGFATLSFVACSDNDDSTGTDPQNATLQEVVSNTSNNVIIATYNDLNQKAIALTSVINQLATTPNAANLQAAKEAWVAARAPWEQTEGFLYGPVDSEGIDPAMDTWPVDVEAMNNILNSSNAITVQTIENNNEARGFHLIEFLLWGEAGNKTAQQLTVRQLELLKAAATDLQNNTQKLYNGWIASGGNFVNNFLNPSPEVYPSYTAVLEEITEGLIIIADEVANGKIEDPLNPESSTPKPELEESRFSNNSKLDFADNMRSIQNIYLGKYGTNGNGKGLTTLIAAKNPVLDTKIKNAVTAAINAINAIPGTFTEAIYSNKNAVKDAQQKVRDLQTILQAELKPFVVNNLQ